MGALPLFPEYATQFPPEPSVQFIENAFYFRLSKVGYPTPNFGVVSLMVVWKPFPSPSKDRLEVGLESADRFFPR